MKCLFFEQLLKEQLNKGSHNFIFAINGSVASDQCMILAALRQQHVLPKIVIYGITPRDLINNGLFCPASTPVFKYLDDCFDIGAYYKHGYDRKDNWLYSAIINRLYYWRENSKLKDLFSILGKRILLAHASNENPTHDFDRRSTLVLPSAEQLKEEIPIKVPTEQRKAKYLLDRKPFLASDLQSYRATYRPFPTFGYKQQLHYLDDMISLCKSEGIRLIVVNMPTSYENVEILGSKNYDDYLFNVQSRITKNGFRFIDMNSLEKFSCGYFYDSVHLNPFGAKIFISNLARRLANKDEGLCASRLVPSSNSDKGRNNQDALASWWLAKSYFADRRPPDVVLFGGSQIGPVQGADAYSFDRLVDITGNHRSYVIEHDLQRILHKKLHVFIGRLPGTRISDQLMVSHALFRVTMFLNLLL